MLHRSPSSRSAMLPDCACGPTSLLPLEMPTVSLMSWLASPASRDKSRESVTMGTRVKNEP